MRLTAPEQQGDAPRVAAYVHTNLDAFYGGRRGGAHEALRYRLRHRDGRRNGQEIFARKVRRLPRRQAAPADRGTALTSDGWPGGNTHRDSQVLAPSRAAYILLLILHPNK
jgi:hypothetical protein